MPYYWFSGKTATGKYVEGYSGTKAGAEYQMRDKGVVKGKIVKNANNTGKKLRTYIYTAEKKKKRKKK